MLFFSYQQSDETKVAAVICYTHTGCSFYVNFYRFEIQGRALANIQILSVGVLFVVLTYGNMNIMRISCIIFIINLWIHFYIDVCINMLIEDSRII